MTQKLLTPNDNYKELDDWINERGGNRIFLVCDSSIVYQKRFCNHLEAIKNTGREIISFSDFQPNPLYENVVRGVDFFRGENCDMIIAVGGGSAIDVAKCIKLYADLPGNGQNGSWLDTEYIDIDIPFLVMPTTAGTGSEATRYAVIYHEGKKQSVTRDSFIPEAVLMDPDCLITLPLYQKKATVMDALCHAIESFWSVNSNDESKEYSRKTIELIFDNMDGYLKNLENARRNMLLAANAAGKAINITQTTAGHAMCYKITSLFGVAHGHAAILCDRVLLPWMIDNTDKCVDVRGEDYLRDTLNDIAYTMGCHAANEAAQKLAKVFDMLELGIPSATDVQFEELKTSVNPARLKNHPVELDTETIDMLYHKILK